METFSYWLIVVGLCFILLTIFIVFINQSKTEQTSGRGFNDTHSSLLFIMFFLLGSFAYMMVMHGAYTEKKLLLKVGDYKMISNKEEVAIFNDTVMQTFYKSQLVGQRVYLEIDYNKSGKPETTKFVLDE